MALFEVIYDESNYIIFAINGKARQYADNLNYVLQDIEYSKDVDITSVLKVFDE